MKILIAASTFPATDTDPVPAFVKDQAIALKKQYSDLTISVLAPHDARAHTKSFTQHSAYDEYRFHYLWPRRFEKLAGQGIWPQLKKNPAYFLAILPFFIGEFFAMFKLVKRTHPDYIYAHWLTPQGIVASLVSALTKTPFVITTHAADAAVWHKVPFGGKVVRHCVYKAKAITAVSPRTLEKLKSFFNEEQWKHVEQKTRIIPMGVSIETTSLENHTFDQRILFVGRLAEKKGVQYLLPAFQKLLKEFPKASLTIAGDGPLQDELKKQARELSIMKNTNFTGYISGSKKQAHIGNSDIYVVPSIITDDGDAEGLPVVFMEGLAAGKVCVATNESGADNIIDNEVHGFLVPQKDVESLYEALKQALTLDKKSRQQMQSKAKEAAHRFDWDTIAVEHYNFLFKK